MTALIPFALPSVNDFKTCKQNYCKAQ